MKATLLACSLLLLTVFFSPVKAQTDTTAMPVYSTLPDTAIYDLGRITMKKKFTQAITIHAADLEKMPFTDLKEALTLYFNGVYGQQQKFAYVIDGVLNTDINAYSIYDIDEITIVQNAATTLNGITPLQVLVLVKTKRGGPNRKGIIAAGQVNQVRKYYDYNATTAGNINNKGNTTQGLYYQYYVSAYSNTKTTKAGLSVDIQHNVFPQYWNKDVYETFKPLAGNRFKFNGYLDVKLDDNNTLSINAGYVPQKDNELYKDDTDPAGIAINRLDQRSIDQKLAYGNIQFKSNIADLFTNNLSAGFQRRESKYNWTSLDPTALGVKSTIMDSTTTINSLVVKDDFSYQGTLDDNEDFTFNANINALYRQTEDSVKYVTTRQSVTTNTNTVASLQKQRLFVITPSVTLNYVDMVSLQVGAQKILNTNTPVFNGSNTPKILPFASLNVDILRTLGATDSVMLLRKLTLYGSYASSMSYAADFTGSLLEIPYYRTTYSTGGTPILREPINPYQTYNQIQGGLTYSMFKKGLTFSYNYSNAKFNAVYFIEGTVAPQTDTARSTTANIVTHRLGINYIFPGNGKFKWTAGVNGAYITNKGSRDNYTLTQLRIFYPGKSLITAGFASQVSYNKAFAGVGLVYDMNRGVYHPPATGNGNFTIYNDMIQGLKLQNVYLGYRLKPLKMVRYLDVFINARNLYQQVQLIEGNIPRYSAEDKRFFGGGIKLEI